MKPIHGEPVPLWETRGLQPVPPIPCGIRLGDVVTFTNDAGIKFPGKTVVGFGRTENGIEPTESRPEPGLCGHFVYLDTDAHWFPHRVDELTKEAPSK